MRVVSIDPDTRRAPPLCGIAGISRRHLRQARIDHPPYCRSRRPVHTAQLTCTPLCLWRSPNRLSLDLRLCSATAFSHCAPSVNTTARCYQRLGDSLLQYLTRYQTWLATIQDELSSTRASLLTLTCRFSPYRQQMDCISSLLNSLTKGSRLSSTLVDTAQLLTVLYEAYATQSRLSDDSTTALLLCLLLDTLEPFLDTLDQVAP